MAGHRINRIQIDQTRKSVVICTVTTEATESKPVNWRVLSGYGFN